jgi:hypothetical protein
MCGEHTGALIVAGVAVADLRVEDATLVNAQAAFRAASDRLAPVVPAVKALDAEVVGAAPLAEKLKDADDLLAAELGITGQALAELAAHVAQIGAAFGHVDQGLSLQVRAAR